LAQIVRLKFLGNIYELKGDDPEVDLQEVASYIEKKAEEVETSQPGLPPNRLMILTVMSLGRELFVARNRLTALEERLEKQGHRLLEKINSSLGEKI
jgi:cell division protein ZapA (FtsZ GTPase activity inhibitor)